MFSACFGFFGNFSRKIWCTGWRSRKNEALSADFVNEFVFTGTYRPANHFSLKWDKNFGCCSVCAVLFEINFQKKVFLRFLETFHHCGSAFCMKVHWVVPLKRKCSQNTVLACRKAKKNMQNSGNLLWFANVTTKTETQAYFCLAADMHAMKAIHGWFAERKTLIDTVLLAKLLKHAGKLLWNYHFAEYYQFELNFCIWNVFLTISFILAG